MKQRNRILIASLLFLFIFSISIVLLTNWSIKRMYHENIKNTFYLLSSIIEYHINSERSFEDRLMSELKQLSLDVESGSLKPDTSLLSNIIRGIWLFSATDTLSIPSEGEIEDDIAHYYENNLSGHDAHSLIVLDGELCYLANFQHAGAQMLVLARARTASGMRIHFILDSLVSSSSLIYFAMLDTNGTPIVYSSLYENFLPLREDGSTTIATPVGRIYHIQESRENMSVIAGFAMDKLARITAINILFLTVMTAAFICSEAVLLSTMSRFDRFRIHKESEVNHFKELSALSSGFTHEFRNSLNTLSLLAKDSTDRQHRKILTEEITRMKSIMDSLKLTGQSLRHKEALPVTDVIDESISLLIHPSKVTIHREIEPGLLCHGSRVMLVTLFSNLLKNSVEAGADRITVAARKKGKRCEILVHDNGAGISGTLHERIYDPFYSSKHQTGLGLYLVKKIVDVHQGAITMESNGGTTFTILL